MSYYAVSQVKDANKSGVEICGIWVPSSGLGCKRTTSTKAAWGNSFPQNC